MEAYIRIEPDADSGLEVETCKRGERDLVVELSVCRAHGRSLVGPPPLELIGEIPDERVTAVGAAVLADWQRLDNDPDLGAFMVFTTCRIWRFAEEHALHEAGGRGLGSRSRPVGQGSRRGAPRSPARRVRRPSAHGARAGRNHLNV